MGADKFIVLRASGPGQVANESLKIRQGQVVRHPGYPVDQKVMAEFTDFKTAQKFAEEQIDAYNEGVTEGITTMKSIEKKKALESRPPTEAERMKTMADAKIMTKEGLVDPAKAAKRIAELEEQLRDLSAKGNSFDADAYLDQGSKVVEKRVKTAAKAKKITKENVEELIHAEKAGKARKSVIETLKELAKNDAVFGKLFK